MRSSKAEQKQSLLQHDYYQASILLTENNNHLPALPHEILENLYSFLSADDLVQVSRTCREFNQVARNQSVWKELFRRDFGQRDVVLNMDQHVDRSNYHKLYGTLREKLLAQKREEEARILAQQERERRQKTARRVEFGFRFLHRFCLLLFVPLLLLLAIVFFALRLNGQVSWSLTSVFSPLFAFFALLAVAMLTYHVSRCRGRWDWFFEIVRDNEDSYCLHQLNDGLRITGARVIPAILLFLSAVLFVVFVCGKLGGWLQWSWYLAVIPLWVAFALLTVGSCCAGWIHRDFDDRLPVLLAMFTFLIPFFVFCLLLVLWLEGSLNTSIEKVLIPLWILDGLFLLCSAMMVGCSASSWFVEEVLDREWCLCECFNNDRPMSLVLCGVSWTVFLPWTAFQILVVLWLHHIYVVSWMVMFTPLLIWFSCLVCVFLVIMVSD
eukprot:TRINITY_DN4630_c0_g1_i1.p1 TRINITY_DN4630_c0_g1~~TRINITY_DN4630_c0_g1_i1.p1  ORF type:complete len:438 (+),score=68.26 TRINITY_DN4630_c0_g1_i1:120-1433(+)